MGETSSDKWDGWLSVPVVTMSQLVQLIHDNPQYYPQLEVGEKRVHRITFDGEWCAAMFGLSADPNRSLHTSAPGKKRVWVQGLALAAVAVSVAAYAVRDAIATDLPIGLTNPASVGSTVAYGVKLVSQEVVHEGVESLLSIKVVYLGGLADRNLLRPIQTTVLCQKKTNSAG